MAKLLGYILASSIQVAGQSTKVSLHITHQNSVTLFKKEEMDL